MSYRFKNRLRKAFLIFVAASGASFVTQLLVQLLMGGIQDVDVVLSRSLMIGVGMAVFVIIMPTSKIDKYPWQ